MRTRLRIEEERFLINDRLVYQEIPTAPKQVHGLLMNARFIQGIFDDKADPARFARFGWDRWDPDRHTDELIEALPQWYGYGLRAFTVGMQGGMPVFTTANSSIDNNPFGPDGSTIDPAYLSRLDRLVRGADSLGMVVIVSILYQGQSPRLKSGRAVRDAVRRTSRWIGEQGFTNVVIEIANEHTVGEFRRRPLVSDPEGVTALMELAKEASGGLPVGASGGGVSQSREVAEGSDVVLIHGNTSRRQDYHRFVRQVRSWNLGKPIVCNEDSPCFTQLDVAFRTGTSWGYYNNLTKQEPPAAWGVSNAEDFFFARRMARGLGMALPALPDEERYVLDGLENRWELDGRRWVRLSAERPESIDRVEFSCNGVPVDTAYEEPFYVNYENTWTQDGVITSPGDRWRAIVHLGDGTVIERTATTQ
jgi:hypothetical protein